MATPWNKIKAEWLKGGTSYRKLGEKYKISAGVIRNRASKEGWGKERLQINDKVMTELRGRVAQARVNHLEKIIEAQEDVLDALRQLAAELKQEPKNLLMDKQGTIRNAESITRALQTAAMTQRDLYGLKNIDQKFAAKKWKEQQKLEREKAAGPQYDEEVWEIQAPEGDVLDG